MLAAEHQHLGGQFGGPFGGAIDFAKGLQDTFANILLGLEKLDIAANDGEEIIEIVGDAAGELADGLHFLGLTESLLRPGAFGHFLLQLFIGNLEFVRAFRDHSFQFPSAGAGFLLELPFLHHRMGELQHFDGVKRFFKDDEAVALAEPFNHFLPGIIRIGGADDDLDVRIDLENPVGGFNSIPARGHAHIDERERIRACGGARIRDHFQALFAAKGGIDFK